MSRWLKFQLVLSDLLEPFRWLKHRRDRAEAREVRAERRLMQHTEALVESILRAHTAAQEPMVATAKALQAQADGFSKWMAMIAASQGEPQLASNSDAEEADRERRKVLDLIERGYPVGETPEVQLRYLLDADHDPEVA